MGSSLGFSLLSLLLFFALPGLFLMRAAWPEWRFRTEEGGEHLLATAAGAVLGSTALTILLGFVLGNLNGGFQATPQDPLLEALLAALAVVFAVVAWVRGAFASVPPSPPRFLSPALPGEEDEAGVLAQFEEMAAEERRLQREIHVARRGDLPRARALAGELKALRARRREMERAREVETSA